MVGVMLLVAAPARKTGAAAKRSSDANARQRLVRMSRDWERMISSVNGTRIGNLRHNTANSGTFLDEEQRDASRHHRDVLPQFQAAELVLADEPDLQLAGLFEQIRGNGE